MIQYNRMIVHDTTQYTLGTCVAQRLPPHPHPDRSTPPPHHRLARGAGRGGAGRGARVAGGDEPWDGGSCGARWRGLRRRRAAAGLSARRQLLGARGGASRHRPALATPNNASAGAPASARTSAPALAGERPRRRGCGRGSAHAGIGPFAPARARALAASPPTRTDAGARGYSGWVVDTAWGE
jgi:hypothetical protein